MPIAEDTKLHEARIYANRLLGLKTVNTTDKIIMRNIDGRVSKQVIRGGAKGGSISVKGGIEEPVFTFNAQSQRAGGSITTREH